MIPWLQSESDPLPRTRLALARDTEAPGLLAAGGHLTAKRLEEAYAQGVFPWYSEGQPVLWWSPDPRMVLVTDEFKVTRSLRKTLARFARTPGCEIRIDSAFGEVIEACAGTPRAGQDGTWIVPGTSQVRWYSSRGSQQITSKSSASAICASARESCP
ncbi:MAG: leucyl/phenylalanyl-tRNA--protein transferase, partial [Caldimonas sp.]